MKDVEESVFKCIVDLLISDLPGDHHLLGDSHKHILMDSIEHVCHVFSPGTEFRLVFFDLIVLGDHVDNGLLVDVVRWEEVTDEGLVSP